MKTTSSITDDVQVLLYCLWSQSGAHREVPAFTIRHRCVVYATYACHELQLGRSKRGGICTSSKSCITCETSRISLAMNSDGSCLTREKADALYDDEAHLAAAPGSLPVRDAASSDVLHTCPSVRMLHLGMLPCMRLKKNSSAVNRTLDSV